MSDLYRRGNNCTRPPWSGQSVRPWIRALAWVWLVILVVLTPVTLWLNIKGGFSAKEFLAATPTVLLSGYLSALFGYAAITGYAPVGWLPWGRGKNRISTRTNDGVQLGAPAHTDATACSQPLGYDAHIYGKRVVAKSHWLLLITASAFLLTLFFRYPGVKMLMVALFISVFLTVVCVCRWCNDGLILQVLSFMWIPATMPLFSDAASPAQFQYLTLVLMFMSLFILLLKRPISRLLQRSANRRQMAETPASSKNG